MLQAIAGWGEVLRSYYNRHTAFRDSDLSNNYLGYYTDNGNSDFFYLRFPQSIFQLGNGRCSPLCVEHKS